MRAEPLPFSPPDITQEEIDEVVDCLRSGWITTGPRTAQFEEAFADYVGAEAAVAVSSGTAAMHTALLALGVGPGDAVIVPTMTFSSAVHVIEHTSATPVLIDSEPDTLNIDATRVAAAVEAQPVKAILPVHLYGQPADLAELAAHGIPVVGDAAHALPARIGDTTIGGHGGMLTAFSFYATKNLATGEGGMLTGPRELVERARDWSLHGMTRDAWDRYASEGSWRYDVVRAGFKYNFPDILAALGLAQLRRLDAMHARRTEIATRYTEALADLVEVPVPRPGTTHAWHIYAIRLYLDRMDIDRARFIDELAKRNISASVHFIPVHTLSYYRGRFDLDGFPVATREFERLVSLPVHTRMSDEDVDDVIEAVTDVVESCRR